MWVLIEIALVKKGKLFISWQDLLTLCMLGKCFSTQHLKYFSYYTLPLVWRGIMVSGWTSLCPSVGPSIRQSYVRPSSFHFRMITWVNNNRFSPNLVCALILWRSGLVLLMGKFRQIFTELSARDTPIFSFPNDNLSKHQWIFTKLGICIDILEIWLEC